MKKISSSSEWPERNRRDAARFANLVLHSNADIVTVEKSLYDAIVKKRALVGVR